ncbi:hypothetical protein ACS0PU_003421 [Formica fusca]
MNVNSILACTQQRRANLTVTPGPKGCKATITPPNRYWVATEKPPLIVYQPFYGSWNGALKILRRARDCYFNYH